MASRIVIAFLALSLAGAAFAQITGLNPAEDFRQAIATPKDPQLGVLFSWLGDPLGHYEVFEASNPGLDASKCPAAPTIPDQTIFGTNYVDHPNPDWYKLPMTDGRWKARSWCYWVSDNGGVTKAGPVSVVIGNAGYVFLGFRAPGTFNPTDICAGGAKLPLPSSNLADYDYQLYYAGPDGVHHNFQVFALFERNVLGLIWHAPSVATDGFVIPWSNTGTYGYTIRVKPLNKTVEGFWAPITGRIRNYYTQVSTDMLLDPGKPDDGKQCADSYFGTFDLWENVVTQ